MKQRLLHGMAVMLALAVVSDAVAGAYARPQIKGDPARAALIDQTEEALLDQIRCRRTPQVARAINAMLKNRLIRYVDGEDGVVRFVPTAPLTLLGLKVRYVGGFDYPGFEGVPGFVMSGSAPPVFLEIVVAAPADTLRKRALDAGLVEEIPGKGGRRGFVIAKNGLESSFLAEMRPGASSIMCTD